MAGAAIVCSPSGPGEAACIPGSFVVAGAVLGCGTGAAVANATNNSGTMGFPLRRSQAISQSCPKEATSDQGRYEECIDQFVEDTKMCDNNFKGRKNVACHAWADEELTRCLAGSPPQPFRL